MVNASYEGICFAFDRKNINSTLIFLLSKLIFLLSNCQLSTKHLLRLTS